MTEPTPPLPVPAPAPAPAPVPAPAMLPTPAHERGLLVLAAGFYGIVTLFSFGYAAFSGGLSRLFGERSPGPGNLLAALAVGLGIVGLCHLADRVLPAVSRAGKALTSLLGPLTYGQAWVLALLSGFAEELLFRGALFVHLGLWGSSLLFGLVHVVPRRALALYPLFAAAAGLLFGFLREGSGSVLPAMLAHAIVNGLNLCWLESRRRREATASPAA